MLAKDRVKITLSGGVPDRVPRGELIIDREFIDKYMHKTNVTLQEEVSFYTEAGLDMACFSDAEKISFTAANSPLFPFGLVNGGLGEVTDTLGFNRMMMELATQPEKIRTEVEKKCWLNTEKGKKLVESGALAIIIGDDIAYNHGTFISPALLRKVLFPSLKRQAAALLLEGVPVLFHSDGNYMSVLPDIIECGFSGLQCMEEAAGMHLAALKENTPPHFCLMGGLDLKYLSPPTTATERAVKVKDIMEAGKEGGPFIFGTNGGLGAELDPKPVADMFRLSHIYANFDQKGGR